MSAPPDFMTQLLQGNNPYGTNGSLYSPAMGLAIGLLQAGGPSRMPVSLGQALGQGLQTGQQFQGAGLQNAMQQLMLGQKEYGMQAIQDAFNPQQSSQPTALPPQPNVPAQQAPVTANIATNSATNGLNAPATNQPLNPLPPIGGKLSPLQPPSESQIQPDWEKEAQQRMDAYQRFSKAAAITQNPQMQAYADGQRNLMQNSWHPMSQSQIQTYTGGKPIPGYGYFVNELGEPKTIGTDAISQLSTFSPATGTFMPTLVDKRTGKPIGGTGSNAAFDPSQPLPGNLESQAQAVASYTQAPPTMSSRNPSAGLILARARAIDPTYDATQFGAKNKAAVYWTSGEGGKQLTAFNTAVSHLATLEPLVENLNNTSSPAFNRVKNFFAKQTGSTAPTDIATAKQYVGGELAKVIAGGNMTEDDRKTAQSALDSANSPEQLKSAIEVIKNLMGGKLTALELQYKGSHLSNFESKLEPASLDALNKFESGQQTQAGGGKTLTYDPATGTFK